MRTVLGAALIALGGLALSFIGFIVWAHHMFTVGLPAHFAWIATAYVTACVAVMVIGLWLLWLRRISN